MLMKVKAKIKNLAKFCFVLGIASYANTAQAASISNSDIVPSTQLRSFNPWTIEKINDGITSNSSPFNGFVSNASKGTISFNFKKEFDLDSFVLWNDVNVEKEGIKDFRLDFFDNSNTLINASYFGTAPVGQLDGQKYTFNKSVSSVNRADLVVLNSHAGHAQRIEIREVAFTGRPSVKSVPEPSNIGGLALVSLVGLGLLANKKRYKALN